MNLKDKLKQEIKSNEEKKINWAKRKKDWIDSVKALDKLIIGWFDDYKKEGLLEFKVTTKQHREEYIGEYSVDILHLCFKNGKEIIIEPMGTLIIGAWGRLDIYVRGYNSGKYYILRNKDDQGVFSWQIVDALTKRDITLLTKISLEKIIEKWLS